MNVKKFPQMDRAKYHVVNRYLSENFGISNNGIAVKKNSSTKSSTRQSHKWKSIAK